jgi:integrase
MAKLTVKELEHLNAKDIGKRLTDEHSLFGLVKPKGDGISVLFRWRYRLDGKLHDHTCGTWPTKSLKEIREAREIAKQQVTQGKDPNESKKIGRLQEKATQIEAAAEAQAKITEAIAVQARISVNDLFERWATVELIRRKDAGKEIQRMFAKDVLPQIGEIAVEDIRKGHVTAVTDALLSRGVTRMAKLIFSLMRQMFRFAVDRDIIESDPTSAIRKAKIGGKDTERDRVLSEDEIRLLAWIVFATCCRIGELLNSEWKDVHFDKREWYIPSENSKNGKPHTIYLSDFAWRHFNELRTANRSSKWCFPNRDHSNHVCSKTVTKQLGDRQRGSLAPMSKRSPHTAALILPGGNWTPHDLRRSGATMMTALGVLPEVAERCLNHTEENRVKRTYQRHSYDKEKREAWQLLGERLDLLTCRSP